MGQMALTGVGAVIGGYFGGPIGAEVGGMVGGIIGGLLFPTHTTVSMPDLRIQNSAYGEPIQWAYGLMRVTGNVIWAAPPTVHTQEHREGGKGFLEPSYDTNTYQISFATALCEGPVNGLRRIWANGTLIYDISNPADFEQISGSANMITNFTFYPGDENQLPDPTIEATEGVGNVPAHRGLSYVVFNNLDLTNYGNTIPNLSFEIVVDAEPDYSPTGNFDYTADTSYITGSHAYLTSLNAGGGLGWANGIATGGSANAYQPFTMTAYGAQPAGPVAVGNTTNVGDMLWRFTDLNGTGQNMDVAGTYYDPSQQSTFINDGPANYAIATLQAALLGLTIGTTEAIRIGPMLFTAGGQGTNAIYSYNFDTGVYDSVVPYPADTGSVQFFHLICASNDFLYATTQNTGSTHFGNLLVLDYDLNIVGEYDIGMLSPIVTIGYAVNDNQVYLTNCATSEFRTQTLKMFNGTTLIDTGITSDSSGNCFGFFYQNGIQYFTDHPINDAAGAHTFYGIAPDWSQLPPITVKDVIDDVCSRAGLQTGQWDATNCTDQLVGYLVGSNSSGKDALTPLLQVYFTDVSDTDGLLKFVRRGASPTVTIPWSAIGATASGAEANLNPLKRTIVQEVDLPKRIAVTYYGANNDYNFVTQTAFRTQTTSNYITTVKAAVAMQDGNAMSCAQAILWSTWARREQYTFETDLSYLYLEPTDVVNVTDSKGKQRTVQITSCQYDGTGIIKWNASSEVPAIYPDYGAITPLQPGPPLGYVPQRVGYAGPTILFVMDLPPLTNTDTTQGLYVAACGYSASWPGAAIEMSRDDSTFSASTTITSPAAMGYCGAALGNYQGGFQPDELNSVKVTLYDPGASLSSITYGNFLNNENVALIGNEIVGFRNATLVSGTTYILNGLLRGLQGTEAAMSTHVAGERFVCLTQGGLGSVGINLTDLGQPLYFQPQTLNASSSQSLTVTQTPYNARVAPLSPALFECFEQGTGATASVLAKWYRRARINNQWLDGTDVPLDESTEGYTVTARDPTNTVLWQFSFSLSTPFSASNPPNATWPATQLGAGQTGIPFGQVATGTVITMSVQQHSDQGVLGNAASFTFTKS
jgi:hypothetical protein